MGSPSRGDRTPPPPPPRSRQKPGSACDECRRRKLRCGREQPRCSVCTESGVECRTNAVLAPRGPKRGHLKALQTRIDVLENRLTAQRSTQNPVQQGSNISPSRTPHEPSSTRSKSPAPLSTYDSDAEISPDDENPRAPSSSSATETLDLHIGTPTRKLSQTSSSTGISDLVRADLDQLYFDRVHLFAPILHRRRYRSWARHSSKSVSQICLQHAMWALATSLSAQFQDLRHALYTDCRQMLETMDLEDERDDSGDIEQVQAWILVTLFEFMRMNHRRGWTSAGRAFRLVQLMRLHDIDGANQVSTSSDATTQMDWVEIEGRRRTFWMAYSLDRFVCLRSGSPLTLQEQVISTRLPAPEMEFQTERPVSTGLLSDIMGALDTIHPSSFMECIVLATICGRGISHMQQSTVERLYGHISQDFWDRHQWLDAIVTQRIKTLSLQYLLPSEQVDPMLLFTNMFAHAAFLFLTKTIETMSRETGGYYQVGAECAKRSLSAAYQIVQLANALSQLSCFKIHPFTPIPIFLGAEFFMKCEKSGGQFDPQLHDLSEALRDLSSVSHLAQEFLHLVELHGAERLSQVMDEER